MKIGVTIHAIFFHFFSESLSFRNFLMKQFQRQINELAHLPSCLLYLNKLPRRNALSLKCIIDMFIVGLHIKENDLPTALHFLTFSGNYLKQTL